MARRSQRNNDQQKPRTAVTPTRLINAHNITYEQASIIKNLTKDTFLYECYIKTVIKTLRKYRWLGTFTSVFSGAHFVILQIFTCVSLFLLYQVACDNFLLNEYE